MWLALYPPNNLTTPNGTTRSVDIYSTDLYFFSGQSNATSQAQGAAVAQNVYNPASPYTQAQMAIGSHYGNMIDTQRGWGNGTLQNFSGGFSTNGKTGRIPIFGIVENSDACPGGAGAGCPGAQILITAREYNW